MLSHLFGFATSQALCNFGLSPSRLQDEHFISSGLTSWGLGWLQTLHLPTRSPMRRSSAGKSVARWNGFSCAHGRRNDATGLFPCGCSSGMRFFFNQSENIRGLFFLQPPFCDGTFNLRLCCFGGSVTRQTPGLLLPYDKGWKSLGEWRCVNIL